ncbi:uncharacterized protein LOC135835578 [Planococcus citri]|uniref:uncharacterized protein LOC135835578 n=1 Tax=Planococcus citri TaxID=170843 RepID=UPI0031F9824A
MSKNPLANLASLTLTLLVFTQSTTINCSIIAPHKDTIFSANNVNKQISPPYEELHKSSASSENAFKLTSSRFKRSTSPEPDQQLDECVKEIQSDHLEAAKEKLSRINDTTKIDLIVQKAYNQHHENFDKILKFGDMIDDVHRRLLIYKALFNELNTSGHLETLSLILLTEHLRFKVMTQDDGKPEIKRESGLLFDAIENAIMKLSIQKITNLFLNKTIPASTGVDLSLPMSSFEYTYKVIRGVIDNILEKLGTKKILSMVHKTNSVKYIEYVIAFQKAIFNKIQSNDSMKNDLVELAIRMNELMKSEAYNNTPSSIKAHIEEVKQNLPKSVRNIAFSSQVCIKNTQYNEFLYAADPTDDFYDRERRYVFTLLGGTKTDPMEPSKFLWKLERRKDDAFEMINDQYNEHLFAGDPKWDDDRRCALTWTPGGDCVNYSGWIFEPEGQEVYIKNYFENEYLFADHDKLHDNKRKVFTYVPKRKTPDSTWEIIDCSK